MELLQDSAEGVGYLLKDRVPDPAESLRPSSASPTAELRSTRAGGLAERLVVTEAVVEARALDLPKTPAPNAAEHHRRVLAVLAFLRA